MNLPKAVTPHEASATDRSNMVKAVNDINLELKKLGGNEEIDIPRPALSVAALEEVRKHFADAGWTIRNYDSEAGPMQNSYTEHWWIFRRR